MEINTPAELAELGRVLQSRCFRSRKILCAFLSYIVQETLAGKQSSITQQRIATEALGKPVNFSATDSPLIRVQAGRLRSQLQEYYTTEGRFNPIRIELPVGSYIPTFKHQTSTLTHLLTSGEEQVSDQSIGPGIVCIPRNFVMDETSGWPFITRLTHEYVTTLSRFSFCQVMLAKERHWQITPSLPTFWAEYPADFALFFDLYLNASSYSLKCSLVHKRNQQIVWGHSFNLGDTYPIPATRQQLFKHIAHDTVGVERGLAHDYWVRQLLDTGKPIVPHYQVIATARQYAWNLSRDTFRHAVHTCRQRLEQFPNDVPALILFADYCRVEYLLKYHEIEPLTSQLIQTVEKLLQLAPDNAYTHLFHAMSCLFQEAYPESEAALVQAQTINPLDTHLNNLTGLGYIGLGQWDKGASLIQDCIGVSLYYPDWYHVALCLYHYREGRYLTAMQEARKIKLKHLWGPMLRTNLYRWSGKQAKGQQEYENLIQEYPTFIEDSDRLTHNFPNTIKGILRRMWSQARDRSANE